MAKVLVGVHNGLGDNDTAFSYFPWIETEGLYNSLDCCDNMALCRLCLSLPFSSLPLPPTPQVITQVGDELISIDSGDEGDVGSQENCKLTGITFHEDLEALTVSAKSCVLCAIVQAGVLLQSDALNEAVKQSGPEPGEIMRLRQLVPSNVRLWLTEPYDGARGFYVWARQPKRQHKLNLMAAVGFSVNSGMTLGVCN